MSRQRRSFDVPRPFLLPILFAVACAGGVPLDELFPKDAGHSSHASFSESAGGSSYADAAGSGEHEGSTGNGGSASPCNAPVWDAMTIYCGQGAVGTEVSLNGKKYACHYWTQAQNPEDHNSADNTEPWSTPTSCP
jgi:hypothetical protein